MSSTVSVGVGAGRLRPETAAGGASTPPFAFPFRPAWVPATAICAIMQRGGVSHVVAVVASEKAQAGTPARGIFMPEQHVIQGASSVRTFATEELLWNTCTQKLVRAVLKGVSDSAEKIQSTENGRRECRPRKYVWWIMPQNLEAALVHYTWRTCCSYQLLDSEKSRESAAVAVNVGRERLRLNG